MASRAQIDRIARSVDRIASVMRPPAVSYVPVYEDETEADALAAYCEEFEPSTAWRRTSSMHGERNAWPALSGTIGHSAGAGERGRRNSWNSNTFDTDR